MDQRTLGIRGALQPTHARATGRRVIGVLLLNHAAREVAATGLTWAMLVIASLQCLLGLGGLGVVAHAAWRDRRK